MEKKLFTYWAIVLFLNLISNQAIALSGSGTELDPYLVTSAADLNDVRNDLTAYYKQTVNIGLSGYSADAGWLPIADGTENQFTGQYNGGGYSISNLTITRGGTANVGLFGHIGRGGVVKNVELVNATVTGGRGTGALVGRVTGDQSTRIEHCSATGTVAGDAATGGLVGSNNSYKANSGAAEAFRPVIYACWADVDVSVRTGAVHSAESPMIKFGGISGCNQKGMISNCYSLGNIDGDNEENGDENVAERIGGVTGCVEFRGIVINSYSIGTVTGPSDISNMGGLVGMIGSNNNKGSIVDSYFTGIDNGFGTLKTNEEIKDETELAGFDFSYIWDIDKTTPEPLINGGYPYLRETEPTPTVWYWKGGTSGNVSRWDQDGNWVDSEGDALIGYPGYDATVNVPYNANIPSVPSSHDIVLHDMYLADGAQIVIPAGRTLTITGDLIRLSTSSPVPSFTGDGELILAGSVLQEIPELIINNLSIDNYNNAKLTGNLTISGTLDMVNGLLDLNGHDIDLGTTGKLNEREDSDNGTSSRIYGTSGTVTAQKTYATINDANLGINISGIGDIGTIDITRGHYALDGQGNSKSILRWFDIEVDSEKNTNLNADVVFTYFMGDLEYTGEVPGFSLFKRPIPGVADDWEVVPSTASTTATSKTLTANNVESFSTWTAANSNTPMPIVLLSFDGKPVNNRVELTWVTAAEINNDYFTIERSVNGTDFEEIAEVEGAGTSSQSKRYSLNDYEPLNGVSYYRLKQTDYNGEFEYSKPISVYLNSSRMADVKVYPNPSNGRFQVVTGAEHDVEYRIVDMQGRTITTGVARPQTVNTIEMLSVPKGIYSLVLISDDVQTKMIRIK